MSQTATYIFTMKTSIGSKEEKKLRKQVLAQKKKKTTKTICLFL
jgi:hypothetical protein